MKTLAHLICLLILTMPVILRSGPAASADAADYSQADLDQMLAPVALYPDTVLSHLLIAATYPLEVVQAARWSRTHAGIKGEDAVNAVEDKDWDPSVKALLAFPELLARMDENLDWTQKLGEAFLAQEGQVMDSVQDLRERAYATGKLNSLEHVRVIRERRVITIEPAFSHIIYVPYYDPWLVYGHWWWPAYPPYSWTYWDGNPVRHYSSGFYWGAGFRVSPVFYFSSFHWHNRHVVVVPVHRHGHTHRAYSSREVVRHRDAQRWQHDSRHRRGVSYRSERLTRDHGSVFRTRNQPTPSARRHSSRDETPRRDVHRSGHSRRARSETSPSPQAGSQSSGAHSRADIKPEQRQQGRKELARDSDAAAGEQTHHSRSSSAGRDDSPSSTRKSSNSSNNASRGRSGSREGGSGQGTSRRQRER